MTYCKQQIHDDFYTVNQGQFPVQLSENAEYNKSKNAKRNIHRLYHNRILKMEETKMFDEVIYKLFNTYWVGPQRDDVELAKKQLLKDLTDQMEGYWSGSTAYYIMVQGGFLIDGKKLTDKKLTALGQMVFDSLMKENDNEKQV